MLDACVHMLVRDGMPFIAPSLEAVLPHVSRVIVAIDSRTVDETRNAISNLKWKYPHLYYEIFEICDPLNDLVNARNAMLAATYEKWVWVVDADEFYPVWEIRKIIGSIGEDDAYAWYFWAVWDSQHAHKSTTNTPAIRLFKNTGKLKWIGRFGKETLVSDKTIYSARKNKNVRLLDNVRYVHFTHVKKNAWRDEMNQKRTVDDRKLVELPNDVKEIVAKFI